jgi:phosphonate transport system substrate-binding protein
VVEDKIDINQIKVVASSRWYPGWVYAYSPRLPEDTADKIRDAMLKLDYEHDPAHRAIFDAAKFIGFVPSDDRDFDPHSRAEQKGGAGS